MTDPVFFVLLSSEDRMAKPHLSSIELEESEICLAGDPVQAEYTIHHPSPNLNQTIADWLACISQPGARRNELPPDNIHHVVLVVILLQSHILILTHNNKTGSEQCAQVMNV